MTQQLPFTCWVLIIPVLHFQMMQQNNETLHTFKWSIPLNRFRVAYSQISKNYIQCFMNIVRPLLCWCVCACGCVYNQYLRERVLMSLSLARPWGVRFSSRRFWGNVPSTCMHLALRNNASIPAPPWKCLWSQRQLYEKTHNITNATDTMGMFKCRAGIWGCFVVLRHRLI